MYKATLLRREIDNIFQRYKSSKFKKNVLNDEDYDDSFILRVEFALSQLDNEESRIFTNDFVEKADRYWWQSYYSKSTYYRLKVRAMERFLDCLNK